MWGDYLVLQSRPAAAVNCYRAVNANTRTTIGVSPAWAHELLMTKSAGIRSFLISYY